MSAFQIKLFGLTDIDRSSLTSMLNLAKDLFTHEWEIIEKGKADLSIYSFDTEEGLKAWQKREDGFTALLTVKTTITEPVDIILKKPLRTSNFSEALNLIEDKITERARTKKAEPKPVPEPKKVVEKVAAPKKKKVKKSSVFSSLSSGLLSKYIHTKKSPASDLPPLSLHIPEYTADSDDTIVDVDLFHVWFNGLNYHDNTHVIAALLDNLIPLNRINLATKVRFELLEIYRKIIHKILFARDIAAIKRDLYVSAQNLKAIQTLSLALEELTIGYKILVTEHYLNGERPDTNKLFLTVINRSAEQLVLQTIHAYEYYRSPPISVLNELHQLYLYCEGSNTLTKQESSKGLPDTDSFSLIFNQLVLTSIADPYSLNKFDVIRLYKLMKKFTDYVEISLLSDKQKKATSDFLMTGHFCLDCASDQHAAAMAKTAPEIRKQPQTRLLNTQPVLLAIEQIFKHAAQSASQGAFDSDIQLLKKIIPQLNTSYERKYQRLPSVQHRQIHIAVGVNNIHTCLKENHVGATLEWTIYNQGSAGIMAKRDSEGCYDLHIGDFMGVFEPDIPVKLASIRWLNIDTDGITHIGLELHPGHPNPVSCLTDTNEEVQVLLLPENDDLKQAATLIAEKGLYSPKRLLKIKGDDDPFSVTTNAIVNNTFNFEQFNFTVVKTK